MKNVLTLLFLISSKVLFAQAIVFDPAVVSTLVFNHTAQQATLSDIKDSEGEIAAAQKVISLKVAQLKELEQKMYDRLKTVTAVIRDGKDIIFASKIAVDIGEYQRQMLELAGENPALLLVAVKTETALVERTADLFTYIYTNAIVGGDINLLDNKDRMEIIKHVVDELRIMRGIAYGVARRMRVAARAGLWNSLNPFDLNWPDQDAAIVADILRDL